jgi:hypothetical protein
MNRAILGETSILVRLTLAAGLAGLALALFLLQRSDTVTSSDIRPRTGEEIARILPELDHDIDTILASFGVEPRWIRKRSVPLEGRPVASIERRIVLPPDIVPVRINAGLSGVARQYRALARAGEDVKNRTVTITIAVDGFVCQTLILKTVNDLRKGTSRGKKTGSITFEYHGHSSLSQTKL